MSTDLKNADKTLVTYFGDGVNTDWHIPFDFLHRSFVVATIDAIGAQFAWVNSNTIRIIPAVPAGSFLVIRRWTDSKKRLVSFKDGSILRARDLDINALQTLHISEEARDSLADAISVDVDGNWEARWKPIKRLGAPVEMDDAVTARWVHEAYGGNLNACHAARDRAEAARDRSVQAETRSVQAESRSVQAETRSVQAETRCEQILVVAEKAEPSANTAIAKAAEATAQAVRAEVAANSVEFPLGLGRLSVVDEPNRSIIWNASMTFNVVPESPTYSAPTYFTNNSGRTVLQREGANFRISGSDLLYVGGASGAFASDGNIHGSIWGGYLSNWLNARGVGNMTVHGNGFHAAGVYINGSRVYSTGHGRFDGMLEVVRNGHIAYGWHVSTDNRLYLGQTNGEGIHVASIMSYANGSTYNYGEFESTGNVIAYSDVRLKTAIKTSPALNAVKKLRGVVWRWKKDHVNAGKQGAGLIAQDVRKVFPEAVTKNPDGMLGLNYNALVGVLVNAVKELSKANDKLQERLERLEERIYGF